jgi:RNA polymerase sigma factor (TIGR02999 family)
MRERVEKGVTPPVSSPGQREVTALLLAWRAGDDTALARLTPLVHDELRRLARAHLRRERPNHTLQPTALVNEVYLRLVDATQVPWQDRHHFFGVTARLMRQVLVDFARRRGYQKRGGHARRVELEPSLAVADAPREDLIAIDDALSALAAVDARKAEVVELRFFGGLSVEETAVVLKVSTETVKRDWRLAKAWLRRALAG